MPSRQVDDNSEGNRVLDELDAALTAARVRLGIDPGPQFTHPGEAHSAPHKHKHEHGNRRGPPASDELATVSSLSLGELKDVEQELLRCLRRVPGLSLPLVGTDGQGAQASTLAPPHASTSGDEGASGKQGEDDEEASSSSACPPPLSPLLLLRSKRALSLCSSCLSLLAEIERARRQAFRHERSEPQGPTSPPPPPPPASLALSPSAFPADEQEEIRRLVAESTACEDGYVRAAMQLQRLLLLGSGDEMAGLDVDEVCDGNGTSKALARVSPSTGDSEAARSVGDGGGGGGGGPPHPHSHAQPQPDRARTEEVRGDSKTSVSSSSSSLFGPSVAVAHTTAPPPPQQQQQRSPRHDDGAADHALAPQEPHVAVVPTAVTAATSHHILDDLIASNDAGGADVTTAGTSKVRLAMPTPAPTTSTATAAVDAAGGEPGGEEPQSLVTASPSPTSPVKTLQRAWTDTQLLQAALRRGVSAAGCGQMSLAANDFALIVKLLFKKCFVVEELVLNALAGDNNDETDSDDGSRRGGGRGGGGGEEERGKQGGSTSSTTNPAAAAAQEDRVLFDPDAITMSMLPPGLDDKDYEEERRYLEERQERLNRERTDYRTSHTPSQMEPTRKAEEGGGSASRSLGGGTSEPASAWVVRALAKVDPDALPLSTLQAHCHLHLPPAYVERQARLRRFRHNQKSSGGGGGGGGAGVAAAAAYPADNDVDSFLGDLATHTSEAEPSFPGESASALDSANRDPLAVLMPALKTTAAATNVLASRHQNSSNDLPRCASSQGGRWQQRPPTSGNDGDPSAASSPAAAEALSPGQLSPSSLSSSTSSPFSLTALFAALLWNVAFTLWEDGYVEDAYQWLCTMELEKLMAVAAHTQAIEEAQQRKARERKAKSRQARQPTSDDDDDDDAQPDDSDPERSEQAPPPPGVYASYRPLPHNMEDNHPVREDRAASQTTITLTSAYLDAWRRASTAKHVSWEWLLLRKAKKEPQDQARVANSSSPSSAPATGGATNIVLPVGTGAAVPLHSSGTSLLDSSSSSNNNKNNKGKSKAGEGELLLGTATAATETATASTTTAGTAIRLHDSGSEGRAAHEDGDDDDDVGGDAGEPAVARSQALWAVTRKIAALRDLGALAICCESSDDMLFLVRHIGAALARQERERQKLQHLSEAFLDQNKGADGVWTVVEKDACMAEVLLMLNLLVEFFLAKRAVQLQADYAQLDRKALASADSYYRQFGMSASPSPAQGAEQTSHHPKGSGMAKNQEEGSLFPPAAAPPTAGHVSYKGSGGATVSRRDGADADRQQEQRAMTAACDELVCAFTAGFYFSLAELDQAGMPTPHEAGTILAPDLSYTLAMNVFSSTMNYASLFRLSKVYRGVVARSAMYRNKTRLGRTARMRREQYQQKQPPRQQQQQQPMGKTGLSDTSPSPHTTEDRTGGSSTGKGLFGFMREVAAEIFGGGGDGSSSGGGGGGYHAMPPSPSTSTTTTTASATAATSAARRAMREEAAMRQESPRVAQLSSTSRSPTNNDVLPQLLPQQQQGQGQSGWQPRPPQRRASFSLHGTPLDSGARVNDKDIGTARAGTKKQQQPPPPPSPQGVYKEVDGEEDGFPADPLSYSLVAWGCLPLPSQRKLIPSPAAASGGGAGGGADTTRTAICVCGLYLLPEFASFSHYHSTSHGGAGVSHDRGEPGAAASALEKKSDAALRLLTALTGCTREAASLEVIPPATVSFVAQELNKAMHVLQIELSRRRGPAWYAQWRAKSHREVHRFYTEALEEVQRLLPFSPLVDSNDANALAPVLTPAASSSASLAAPPSMPSGERLPYSPSSRLPPEHQLSHHLVTSAPSMRSYGGDKESRNDRTAAATTELERRVLARNVNDHLRWEHGGGGDERSHCGSGLQNATPQQGADSCSKDNDINTTSVTFSTWWEKPLSIPSDSALKKKKNSLGEANAAAAALTTAAAATTTESDDNDNEEGSSERGKGGAAGQHRSRTRKAARRQGEAVRMVVAWDAPPAFIPEVTIDFSAFTTTSLETQLWTKKMVADAVARQREEESRCATDGAKRNVRRGGVSLLSAACRQLLHDELPMLQQYCHWRVIYSTKFHGVSMQTMLKSCQQEAESAAMRSGGGYALRSDPFASSSLSSAPARPMLLVMELSPSTSCDFSTDSAGVTEAADMLRAKDEQREQRHRAAALRKRRSRTTNVNCMDPTENDTSDRDGDDGEEAKDPEGNNRKEHGGTNSIIIGAFLSDLLKMDSRRYYGSNETFVFQLFLPAELETHNSNSNSNSDNENSSAPQPLLRTYRSSGQNAQYINCRMRSIVVGGGGGGAAIYLDDSLVKGASSACATFASPPLTTFELGSNSAMNDSASRDEDGGPSPASPPATATPSMGSFDVMRLEIIVMD